MYIHRIDWKVLQTPEREAVKAFSEEVSRVLEPQYGCIGVASWGYDAELHTLSAWETAAEAEAAATLIAAFMEEQGDRWWPIMTGRPHMEVIGRTNRFAESEEQAATREEVGVG